MAQVDAVNVALARNEVDAKNVVMHIEGRDVSLADALSVVRYHTSREYPHLIRSGDPHTVMAIQATNLNDQFLIMRISKYEGLPAETKAGLESLSEQLTNIMQ